MDLILDSRVNDSQLFGRRGSFMIIFRWSFWVLIMLSVVVFAEEPVSTGFLSNTAIGAHDVVAYHRLSTGDDAVEGSKTYSFNWKGANWYFSSQKEKEAFIANPIKYAPAYNGHCANALSLGEGLVKTDGTHWAVLDGQLYLFYAARGAKRWLEGDYKNYKTVADKAWASIIAKK